MISLPSFTNPTFFWLFPFLLTILGIGYFRGKRGLISLLLRFITFSLLILALTDPFYPVTKIVSKEKIIALIDNSKSMTDEEILDCTNKFTNAISNRDYEVFYFANDLMKVNVKERQNFLTNFEQSLKSASLKYGGSNLVICSDGRETSGDLSLVADQVRTAFSSISILYPEQRKDDNGKLRFSALNLPTRAKETDSVNLAVTIKNLSKAKSFDLVSVYIDKNTEKQQKISIDGLSESKMSFLLGKLKAGEHKISVKLKDSLDELSQWIKIEKTASYLLYSKANASSKLLEKTLRALNIEYKLIDPSTEISAPSLSQEETTSIILNNIKASDLSNSLQKNIEAFVQKGGGLAILGGDSSFGIGGYQNTVIDKISPLKSVPPRSKLARAPSAVMLLIDKSGSMGEQGKLHSAKLAALSSIYSLKADDYVGVIGFDYAPLSIIEIDKVQTVKLNAKQRLVNLTAYGSTNLLPGLSLARLRLSKTTAAKKHVVILSDGRFPNSSDAFVAEINRLREEGITVSTVALGYEADAPFMKMLAQAGKGTFYQTMDASALPKLFVNDIKVAVGEDTMKEESSYSVKKTSNPNPLLNDYNVFPELLGFVETEAKPAADLLLFTEKSDVKFPVLATWSYQQGRVTSFAADLQGRWTGPWLRWSDYLPFWEKVFKALEPGAKIDHTTEGFDFRYKIIGGRLNVELFIYDRGLESALASKLVAELSIHQKNQRFNLTKQSRGRYEGQTDIKEAGDYTLKFNVKGDKSYKLSVLGKDLGEDSISGNDYHFLGSLKSSLNANLGEVAFQSKEFNENLGSGRSKALFLPLILSSMLSLLLEVFIRERKRL